ncbi:hypothetical protein A3Q56_07746 [Intoshia linei]|uniref:Uncharacterized protein n=1 Tax=Intoshia linei TaxID=1819745 RepID=A0A177ARC7_9BILA|nr:hypothetical protein A3Q56_07746 [Intoshia linei]
MYNDSNDPSGRKRNEPWKHLDEMGKIEAIYGTRNVPSNHPLNKVAYDKYLIWRQEQIDITIKKETEKLERAQKIVFQSNVYEHTAKDEDNFSERYFLKNPDFPPSPELEQTTEAQIVENTEKLFKNIDLCDTRVSFCHWIKKKEK